MKCLVTKQCLLVLSPNISRLDRPLECLRLSVNKNLYVKPRVTERVEEKGGWRRVGGREISVNCIIKRTWAIKSGSKTCALYSFSTKFMSQFQVFCNEKQ